MAGGTQAQLQGNGSGMQHGVSVKGTRGCRRVGCRDNKLCEALKLKVHGGHRMMANEAMSRFVVYDVSFHVS